MKIGFITGNGEISFDRLSGMTGLVLDVKCQMSDHRFPVFENSSV